MKKPPKNIIASKDGIFSPVHFRNLGAVAAKITLALFLNTVEIRPLLLYRCESIIEKQEAIGEGKKLIEKRCKILLVCFFYPHYITWERAGLNAVRTTGVPFLAYSVSTWVTCRKPP